jgi:hypothetical protein
VDFAFCRFLCLKRSSKKNASKIDCHKSNLTKEVVIMVFCHSNDTCSTVGTLARRLRPSTHHRHLAA